MECSINLQKNLLRQILSLIGSSGEAVSQVIDSGVPVSDDDLPGFTVAAPASLYQFGVGRFQRSDSASTTG
jgi:hypothetical protein